MRRAPRWTVAPSVLSVALGLAILAGAGCSSSEPPAERRLIAQMPALLALTELPVATAMTLNYSSPLFLVILVAALAREKPGAKLIATVFLGLSGIWPCATP